VSNDLTVDSAMLEETCVIWITINLHKSDVEFGEERLIHVPAAAVRRESPSVILRGWA